MIKQKQHRTLGATGIEVSPLGVGTNRWRLGKNDDEVFAAYQALTRASITFFDTAEIYQRGNSERLLGSCIQRDPQKVVIASKFAPFPPRWTQTDFMNALDSSLQRLGRESLDLYYIHMPPPLLSINKLMDMMATAVKAGKIRAVGVSNFSAVQIYRAADRLARYDIPLAAIENHYNLFQRQVEINGVLEACQQLNVALVAYYPLAKGRLTAAQSTTEPEEDRKLNETLQNIAQQRGKTVSQVALNWMLRRDSHIIPIPGVTSARHVSENVEALNWELSDEEFQAIDQDSSQFRHH